MGEVVSPLGNERRTRRAVVVLVLALLAGASAVLVVTRAGDPAPRPAASATPTVEPPGGSDEPEAPAPTVTPAGPLTTPLVAAPAWRGRRDTLVVFDPQAGVLRLRPDRTVSPVPRVGGPVTVLFPVAGGTVVYDDPAASSFIPSTTPRVSFVGSDGTVERLARAMSVVPAVDPTTIWLVNDRELTRVAVRGGAVRQRVRLPEATSLVAEVVNGLLLRPRHAYAPFVWDPRTRRIVRTLTGDARPGTARHVVLRNKGCRGPCISVADVVTGATRRVRAFDSDERALSLSPDGRWLVSWRHDGGAGLLAYDLARGRAVRVPVHGPARGATLGWSRDGKLLYVGLLGEGGDQILVWQAGDAGLYTLANERAADIAAE